MGSRPTTLLAIALLLAPSLGMAIPPPHRRHTFAGSVSPDPGAGRPARMTLRMDCILYSAVGEGDDFCTGRFSCKGTGCPLRSGTAELSLLGGLTFAEARADPSRPATLNLLGDGGDCTVAGRVAYDLGPVIPAFAGRYECSIGAIGGLFGMRAGRVGERFYDLG